MQARLRAGLGGAVLASVLVSCAASSSRAPTPTSTSSDAPAATTGAMHSLPAPVASSVSPAPPAAASVPGPAASLAQAPLPGCGFIDVTIRNEMTRLDTRQRFEVVDPDTGARPRVHLDADNADPRSRWLSVYVGGEGALDRKTRMRLVVPAKTVTGPNLGREEIEGQDVKVAIRKLGAPGEHVIGTFRATVKIDGKDVQVDGAFDVCRLPDRKGP